MYARPLNLTGNRITYTASLFRPRARIIHQLEIPQRTSLLPYQGVLSFGWKHARRRHPAGLGASCDDATSSQRLPARRSPGRSPRAQQGAISRVHRRPQRRDRISLGGEQARSAAGTRGGSCAAAGGIASMARLKRSLRAEFNKRMDALERIWCLTRPMRSPRYRNQSRHTLGCTAACPTATFAGT